MPGDYVMLKQQTDSTLDAPARPHVLRVVEIKKSGVALLEGSNAVRVEEQKENIAHCPLPIHKIVPRALLPGPFTTLQSLWEAQLGHYDGDV